VLVFPKEESKSEKGQVVICSLEAGKACQSDHNDEHLLNMLDHLSINDYLVS
jgi:hypothetical protein